MEVSIFFEEIFYVCGREVGVYTGRLGCNDSARRVEESLDLIREMLVRVIDSRRGPPVGEEE